MVKLIIDAIIDNYERKIDDMRRELYQTSTALASANAVRDEAINKEVDLLKQVTQLKRDLSSAQLDKLRAMDHLIAVVGFVSRDTAVRRDSICRAALRDALYAIPANVVTTDEQARIDALVKAIDKVEAQE